MTILPNADVTVCIATIPPRKQMLRQAFTSAIQQTLQPHAIIVEVDAHRQGACATKNRALAKVETKWVAWLDDDDILKPNHIETLWSTALREGVDVVYPWPEMDGSPDPRPDRFGVPFDAEELRRGSYIPTTSLFNAKLAREVGGFQHPDYGPAYDDWGLYLAMLDAGAKFYHVPERTWIWRVQGQNTSGDPTRW